MLLRNALSVFTWSGLGRRRAAASPLEERRGGANNRNRGKIHSFRSATHTRHGRFLFGVRASASATSATPCLLKTVMLSCPRQGPVPVSARSGHCVFVRGPCMCQRLPALPDFDAPWPRVSRAHAAIAARHALTARRDSRLRKK